MESQRESVKAVRVGRPTKCTKKVSDEICERIAMGQSLRRICRDEHLPHYGTVVRWVVSTDERYAEFRDQYARARKAQAELLVDEMLDIADDGTNDWVPITDEKGHETGAFKVDHEHINRSRLRVDTRKWYASKVLPKIYGDRTILNTDRGEGLEGVNAIVFKVPEKVPPEAE